MGDIIKNMEAVKLGDLSHRLGQGQWAEMMGSNWIVFSNLQALVTSNIQGQREEANIYHFDHVTYLLKTFFKILIF